MNESYSGGLLTVTSGGTAVAIINVGSGYTTSSFQLSSDPVDSSTIITDPAVSGSVTFKRGSEHGTGSHNGFNFLQIIDAARTLADSRRATRTTGTCRVSLSLTAA